MNNKLLIGWALAIVVPKDKGRKRVRKSLRDYERLQQRVKFTIKVSLISLQCQWVRILIEASYGNRYGDWDRRSLVNKVFVSLSSRGSFFFAFLLSYIVRGGKPLMENQFEIIHNMLRLFNHWDWENPSLPFQLPESLSIERKKRNWKVGFLWKIKFVDKIKINKMLNSYELKGKFKKLVQVAINRPCIFNSTLWSTWILNASATWNFEEIQLVPVLGKSEENLIFHPTIHPNNSS